MLTFEDLRTRLLESLRAKVRNGEVTERRLARVTGISQPHVHNLLKGVRSLTPEVGDQILHALQISLTDFLNVPAAEVSRRAAAEPSAAPRYISMLDGFIGPAHPWPSQFSLVEQYLLTDPRGFKIENPIAARTAEDVRMGALFGANDIVVLDQSTDARTTVDPEGLYLVKEGISGLLRRARITGTSLYVFPEDCRGRPSAWQRIPLNTIPITQTIRAKVLFPADENQWEARVA